MLLYKAYAQVMQLEGNKLPSSEINNRLQGLPTTLNYELIEKSIKTYKSHRNARDFDVKFINNFKLDSQNCKILKMVVKEMKTSF
jgi:2-phosphoglycerate kinase